MNNSKKYGPFHSSKEEYSNIVEKKHISHYELAFLDQEFLMREELRPVRLQLELLKPELILQDHGVESTVVVFGSARIPPYEIAEESLNQAKQNLAKDPENPQCKRALKKARNVLDNSRYLAEATKFAYLVSKDTASNYMIVTGGGPSFMEAANRGAYEAGKPSVSLGVLLPHEQKPNGYVTPDLTFQFHYFAIRKMHFLMRAKALVAFPGGFGTFDELFETLTLMQTQKIKRLPLILFSKNFWDKVVNFEGLVMEGTIDEESLNLISYVETAEEAWAIIQKFYQDEEEG